MKTSYADENGENDDNDDNLKLSIKSIVIYLEGILLNDNYDIFNQIKYELILMPTESSCTECAATARTGYCNTEDVRGLGIAMWVQENAQTENIREYRIYAPICASMRIGKKWRMAIASEDTPLPTQPMRSH